MTKSTCDYCGYKSSVQQSYNQGTGTETSGQTNMGMVLNNIPEERKSSKDKVVALLLCIFFGFFGVHRFYVGKIGSGIAYLVTGGAAGIGWIIDIVLICTNRFKDSDERYLM